MTDSALPIDPASETITDDIRRKIDEKAAVKRGEVWQAMGCPTSPTHMEADKYHKEFRGRMWFHNRSVFEQAQQMLRIILCPKCLKEESYGAIEGTRFFITVEDDVMTVFPAVGHFLCHYCGFEEWQPLKHDPRAQAAGQMSSATAREIQARAIAAQQQYGGVLAGQQQGIGRALGGSLDDFRNALHNSLANKAVEGIDPNMGPIWGMNEDEKRALHRLYQHTKKATSPPPPIVETRAEAEMLIKLAPVERRQAIIQKLRDKGLI